MTPRASSTDSHPLAFSLLCGISIVGWILLWLSRSRFAPATFSYTANPEFLASGLLTQLLLVWLGLRAALGQRLYALARRRSAWVALSLLLGSLGLHVACGLEQTRRLLELTLLAAVALAGARLLEGLGSRAPRASREQGGFPLLPAAAFTAVFLGTVGWFVAVPVATDLERYLHGAPAAYLGYHAARLLLIGYLLWIPFAVGDPLLRRLDARWGLGVRGADRLLGGFFLGSALMHLAVLALCMGLLYRWLLAGLLAPAVFFSYPAARDATHLALRRLAGLGRLPWSRRCAASLLLGSAALSVGLLLAAKGLFPGTGHDYTGHYLPYYDAVLQNHGTALNDVWYHHFHTRGAGALFVALALSDRLGAQLASAAYTLAMLLAVGQLARRASGGRTSWGVATVAVVAGGLVWTPQAAIFEKQHVVSMSLLLGFVWACVQLELAPAEHRRRWLLLAAAIASNLTIFATSTFFLALGTSGLLAARALLQRRWSALRAYVALPVAGGLTLLGIWTSNYLSTGMADVVPFRPFWEHADQARLSGWISPYLVLFLELGSGSVGQIAPLQVSDPLGYWADCLRLWDLVPLCGHPLALAPLVLAAGCLRPREPDPARVALGWVAGCLGYTALAVSLVANQPFSMFRFLAFLLPLGALLTVWAWQRVAAAAPAGARARIVAWLPLFAAPAATFLALHAIPTHEVALRLNYLCGRGTLHAAHTPTWEQGPELLSLPVVPRTVYTLTYLDGNLAPPPVPRVASAVSISLGPDWHEALFEPAARARTVLEAQGIRYLWVDLDRELFDLLQFSPLLRPDVVEETLAVAWQRDSMWLLTFRGTPGSRPVPAEFVQGYRAAIESPEHWDFEPIYRRMQRIYRRNKGRPYPLEREPNLPPLKGWQGR